MKLNLFSLSHLTRSKTGLSINARAKYNKVQKKPLLYQTNLFSNSWKFCFRSYQQSIDNNVKNVKENGIMVLAIDSFLYIHK